MRLRAIDRDLLAALGDPPKADQAFNLWLKGDV